MKIHPKGNPTIRSTVLPPPLERGGGGIETIELRQHFSGWGQKKLFFSRSCIFHGYFLFNLAPREPQLATKMAPALLGLAGALDCNTIMDSLKKKIIFSVISQCVLRTSLTITDDR